MPREKKPLHIMLPPDEYADVRAFADSVGKPMSHVCRDALQTYMKAHRKDAARIRELSARLKAGPPAAQGADNYA